MINPQHTPEPWRVESTTVWNKDFRILQTDHCGSNKGDIKQANAKRIVTCVNACAGIANPEALPDIVETLRVALKDASQIPEHASSRVLNDALNELICQARDALAKLEGKRL